MRQRFLRELDVAWALFLANLRVHAIDWRRTLLQSFFMLAQNAAFFVMWIILFGAVRTIGGWNLADVAMMYGLVASSIGTSLFFFDGIRNLPELVRDGSLDVYLTRPTHTLPAVVFSRTCAASLGDVLTGPLYWLIFCDVTPGTFAALMVLMLAGAIMFSLAMVLINSLVFYVRHAERLAYQLVEVMIIACSVPLHTQPFLLKVVFFSLMPAGFVSYLPKLIAMDYAGWKIAVMGAAMGVYAVFGGVVFARGVRRYVG